MLRAPFTSTPLPAVLSSGRCHAGHEVVSDATLSRTCAVVLYNIVQLDVVFVVHRVIERSIDRMINH